MRPYLWRHPVGLLIVGVFAAADVLWRLGKASKWLKTHL